MRLFACRTRQAKAATPQLHINIVTPEESAELSESGFIEELADLQEVVNAIRKELGIPEEELEKVRASKADKRGGFDKGIVLLEVNEK